MMSSKIHGCDPLGVETRGETWGTRKKYMKVSVKSVKNGNSAGPDQITAGTIKTLGSIRLQWVKCLQLSKKC